MSLAASDWHTTHAYTYRPPNLTPGYTGYIPQQRYGYGDTFGNTTAEHFQARRNIVFLSSVEKKEYSPPLEKFPTVYSNEPSLVLANRKRCRERWIAAEKYTRSNEGTKKGEMQNFLKGCQEHRENYNDSTGTVRRVDEFLLPKLTANTAKNRTASPCRLGASSSVGQLKQESPLNTVKDYINRSYTRALARFRGNCRQRAIRDQVFENR